MSRLQHTLTALQRRGEKAMGLFLTSGFPTPQDTLPILEALDEAGANFIELGMPFSDPLGEGLPIQRSSARALGHGIRMADTFQTAKQFRAQSETPLLLMGYINPILRYGVSNFCQAARSSGVDGLILPDLPPEESGLVAEQARKAGLDLIFLIAPNTPDERVAEIDALTSGFVYAVSITGLTGSGLGDRLDAVAAYLRHARSLTRHNPLLVGFGIKSHADAQRLCAHTDGFIVGSALVETIEKLWQEGAYTQDERLAEVRRFAHTLKYGEHVLRDT